MYDDLSVHETLLFFARLYQMKNDEFKRNKRWLLEFLDLPPSSRIVRNLSGGQKRRLSLATALIHKPDLLILDEPTVGVDPLLRHRIWEHLREVAATGCTIIITTHYIQEAVGADIVGLMRNRRILAEGPPQQLMKRYDLPTLEEVFLKLCRDVESLKPIQSPPSLSNQDDKEEKTLNLNVRVLDPP